MRLSTDDDRSEERSHATVAAAAAAGITVFDTAHAYGRSAAEYGHNESLVAQALKRCGAAATARVVTKGGMTRAGTGWLPDGRGKALQADCEASLRALDGLPIDLYLVHAPDSRTPWRTTVRALARLLEQGLVRRAGVSNVNLHQLEEALSVVEISAVQVPLNPFDDRAMRGGVVRFCEERGIAVMAYSPLGGPRRAGGLARVEALAAVAAETAASPAQVALAWLLEVSPVVVPIPGARRPAAAESAAAASRLRLSDAQRELLFRALGGRGPKLAPRPEVASGARGEIVMVMGIPGAGKSRIAESFAAEGYTRLNRDLRGGTLKQLAGVLDAQVSGGVARAVLDNTYLTRAARNHVIETARRHGLPVRCIWVDIPLEQAQVNLVERLLETYGSLPSPEELRRLSRLDPGVHTPTSQMRTLRELEVPSLDEGVATVERVPFARRPGAGRHEAAVFVAAEAVGQPSWREAISACDPDAPHLVFRWCPGGCAGELDVAAARLREAVRGPVEAAFCPHGGGAPQCWCRPPLPGLPLAFARAHGVDPGRSILVGTSATHRRLAATLGARYAQVPTAS